MSSILSKRWRHCLEVYVYIDVVDNYSLLSLSRASISHMQCWSVCSTVRSVYWHVWLDLDRAVLLVASLMTLILWPRRTDIASAACSYRSSSVSILSVGRSVCPLVTAVNSEKNVQLCWVAVCVAWWLQQLCVRWVPRSPLGNRQMLWEVNSVM